MGKGEFHQRIKISLLIVGSTSVILSFEFLIEILQVWSLKNMAK